MELIGAVFLALMMLFSVIVADSNLKDSFYQIQELLDLKTFKDQSLRHKRATSPMTDSLRTLLIDKHNEVRRQEEAADMETMIWNNYLEELAHIWAEKCEFDHGLPAGTDYTKLDYKIIGQNLFYQTGIETPDVNKAMNAWYTEEKREFSWNAGQCAIGKSCGHYKQVTWAESREMGCSYQFCKLMTTYQKQNISNALLLVCHYGPGGNSGRTYPYQKGTACTACPSGSGWCDNGLCSRKCQQTSGPNCKCALTRCDNCGTFNSTSCTCQCPNGWYGNDCRTKCQDLNKRCNANPGWPSDLCRDPEEYPDVYAECPEMCGKCKPANPGFICLPSTVEPATASQTTTTTPEITTASVATKLAVTTATLTVENATVITTGATERTTKKTSGVSILMADKILFAMLLSLLLFIYL